MNIILSTLLIFFTFQSQAEEKCVYEFLVNQSKITVTGFKYTEKTGVAGTIRGIKLNKNESVKTPQELLNGLVVSVDLMTLDSGNALRDNNLRETLFAEIFNDSVATVSVKKVTKDKIETDFNLNDKVQKITFDYKMTKEGNIEAKGVFDALQFALKSQMTNLQKRCGSLHTGSDGKSVTWSDFNLLVDAKIKKKCL